MLVCMALKRPRCDTNGGSETEVTVTSKRHEGKPVPIFFLSFFAATSPDFVQGATVVAGADTRNVASMPGDDGRALFSAMQKDTDIAAEAASLQQAMRRLEVGEVELQPPAASTAPTGSVGPPLRHVRLNWYPNQGGHQPNNETRRLLQEVGGTEALAHFTQR